MAVTLSDTFTDTNGTLLTDHDPDAGDVGSWGATAFGIGGTSPNDDLTISTNRVQTVNSGSSDAVGAVCRNSTDPGADEYDIDVVMQTRSATQNNRYTAVLWRMTPTGTADGDVDRYLLLLNGSAGEWQLYKIVSGSLTLLTSDAANYAASTTYDVHVEVRSSGTTMSVSVDDGGGGGLVEILTSTDTDITQRGRVGVSTNRSGDGDIWMDDLTVDSVGASGQDITPAAQTVDATPGTLTLGIGVDPAAVTVDATAGTLSMAIGVTPGAVSIDATPGTVTVAPGAVDITPDPVTVTATPGTVTVSSGATDITPAAVTIDVAPGTTTVDLAVPLAGPTIEITPGAVTIAPGAADIVPDSVTIQVTPGVVAVSRDEGVSGLLHGPAATVLGEFDGPPQATVIGSVG